MGGGGVPSSVGVEIGVDEGGGGVPPLFGVEMGVNEGGGGVPPPVGVEMGVDEGGGGVPPPVGLFELGVCPLLGRKDTEHEKTPTQVSFRAWHASLNGKKLPSTKGHQCRCLFVLSGWEGNRYVQYPSKIHVSCNAGVRKKKMYRFGG